MKSGAPIITTILLVAISVVGGCVLFVFAQGFAVDEQININMQPEFSMNTNNLGLCENSNLKKTEKSIFNQCP